MEYRGTPGDSYSLYSFSARLMPRGIDMIEHDFVPKFHVLSHGPLQRTQARPMVVTSGVQREDRYYTPIVLICSLLLRLLCLSFWNVSCTHMRTRKKRLMRGRNVLFTLSPLAFPRPKKTGTKI